MTKISKVGADKLQVVRNALNSMYSKLENAGVAKNVQEEFNYIAETLSDVQSTWEKVDSDGNNSDVSVIINGKIYKQVGG